MRYLTVEEVAAAIIVPKVTGKGLGAAIIGAIVAVYLHSVLDAPLARAMAALGIQFGS